MKKKYFWIINGLILLFSFVLIFSNIQNVTYAEVQETTSSSTTNESQNLSRNITPNVYSSFPGYRKISDIFPDKNLARVVANTIGKRVSDSINQRALNAITTLSADSVVIANIEGIQYLNNITKLSFQDSQNITSLEPLKNANLSKLKQLYLRNNKISDLSPLASAGLVSLEELYIENNSVSSLVALESITTLKKLSIENNDNNLNDTVNTITSLDSLKNLVNLQYLWAANNSISSLEPLSNLSKLVEVYVENNKLTSLNGLENKNNLISLSAMYQNIDSVTPISGNTNLKNLYIRDNEISDISPLSNLTNLTLLLMEQNHVYDISSLSILNLTTFSATNQTVTLPTSKYSSLVEYSVKNIVIGRDKSVVAPNEISNSGKYTDSVISWKYLPEDITQISYSWSTNSPVPGTFSGTVTQSLEEVKVVSFDIENLIENNPDSNQKITYNIKMITADGEVILPDANGLDKSETDEETGVFSLGSGESISLLGLEGTSYQVTTTIDTDLYNVEYTAVHGDNETQGDITKTKIIEGTLTADPNQLNITNKYKSLLKIDTSFIPEDTSSTAIYDLVFVYPDGTTSGDLYKNITISENTPFEVRAQVGSSYTLTQHELESVETTASVIYNDEVIDRNVTNSSDNVVTGNMQLYENRVNFTNVQTKDVKIEALDISSYPTYNNSFTYSVNLIRLDGENIKYTANIYDSEGNKKNISFTSNTEDNSFSLKSGEYIIFDQLPINLQIETNQLGVDNYATTIETKDDNSLIISDGMTGEGASFSGTVDVSGNQIKFINQTDYIPPVTGVSNNSNFMLQITILFLVIIVLMTVVCVRIRVK